jgi:hypothetical protein
LPSKPNGAGDKLWLVRLEGAMAEFFNFVWRFFGDVRRQVAMIALGSASILTSVWCFSEATSEMSVLSRLVVSGWVISLLGFAFWAIFATTSGTDSK